MVHCNIIWTSTRENLSSGFANNKGADQPAQSDQRLCVSLFEKYTQKKKFSQYLCFLIKSTILDILLSNCIHELYYRNFTCTCLLCDR